MTGLAVGLPTITVGYGVGRGVGAGVGAGQLLRPSVVTVDIVKVAATAVSMTEGSAAAAARLDWTVADPAGVVVWISKPTEMLVERRRRPAGAASMETMFTACSLTPATSAIAISNISVWSARVLTEMPANSTVPRTTGVGVGAGTGGAVGKPGVPLGAGVGLREGRGDGAGIGRFVDGSGVGLRVGTCDGASVGRDDGRYEGAGVGCKVGLGEGAGVGRGVG